jgi:hypothetical protein
MLMFLLGFVVGGATVGGFIFKKYSAKVTKLIGGLVNASEAAAPVVKAELEAILEKYKK